VDRAAFTETAVELLERAKAAGHDVSPTQLARWHRAGLLPRPKQCSLGKGQGTQTLYPLGTGRQLLALCTLHAKERRLASIGWHLWWAGFPVADEYHKRALRDAASWWDQEIEKIQSFVEPSEDDDDALSEQAWELIEGAGSQPIRHPIMGPVRKRVGRSRFATSVRIVLETLQGTFAGWGGDYGASEEDESDSSIMEKALGLPRARKDTLNGAGPWLTGDIAPELERIEELVSGTSLTAILDAASGERVVQARNELTTLLVILTALSFAGKVKRGRPGFGLGMVRDIAGKSNPRQQAILLLLWLALRQDPAMQNGMSTILESAAAWIPSQPPAPHPADEPSTSHPSG
jgi:hypothetical protein